MLESTTIFLLFFPAVAAKSHNGPRLCRASGSSVNTQVRLPPQLCCLHLPTSPFLKKIFPCVLMERKPHFMVGREGARLSNCVKCCSLITSDNCPMPFSCSGHTFSWAWVTLGISERALFSWVCLSLWFLCSCLSINMSLPASHLDSPKSLICQWLFALFSRLDRNFYHLFFSSCEIWGRGEVLLIHSLVMFSSLRWSDNMIT